MAFKIEIPLENKSYWSLFFTEQGLESVQTLNFY